MLHVVQPGTSLDTPLGAPSGDKGRKKKRHFVPSFLRGHSAEAPSPTRASAITLPTAPPAGSLEPVSPSRLGKSHSFSGRTNKDFMGLVQPTAGVLTDCGARVKEGVQARLDGCTPAQAVEALMTDGTLNFGQICVIGSNGQELLNLQGDDLPEFVGDHGVITLLSYLTDVMGEACRVPLGSESITLREFLARCHFPSEASEELIAAFDANNREAFIEVLETLGEASALHSLVDAARTEHWKTLVDLDMCCRAHTLSPALRIFTERQSGVIDETLRQEVPYLDLLLLMARGVFVPVHTYWCDQNLNLYGQDTMRPRHQLQMAHTTDYEVRLGKGSTATVSHIKVFNGQERGEDGYRNVGRITVTTRFEVDYATHQITNVSVERSSVERP